MNAPIIASAMKALLGPGQEGSLAFTRAFSRMDIQELLDAGILEELDWRFVAVGSSAGTGWITADQAVELREDKGKATFLLVDTKTAGAGMDGIFSAAREVDEKVLYKEANKILSQRIERGWREFAEDAIKRARRLGGRRRSTSLHQEFEFSGLVEQRPSDAGRHIHLLGLWPIIGSTPDESSHLLAQSALMVEKLLMPPATSQAPAMRINGLVLSQSSPEQITLLEGVLRNSGSQPRSAVLEAVVQEPHLWLGNLRPAFLDSRLAKIEIISWRRPNGKLWAWSGLQAIPDEDLPYLQIDPENPQVKLEVRWRTEPDTLMRGSVNYEVQIRAGAEVLASRQIEHSDKLEQKVLFTYEDFEDLDVNSKLEAFVEISAVAQNKLDPERTEDFIITYGEAPIEARVSSGEIFRCLADGLVQASSPEEVAEFVDQRQKGQQAVPDKHGYVSCRLAGMRRGFRVERPRLLQEVEREWSQHSDHCIGRWIVRCRADGFWTSRLEYRSLLEPSANGEAVSRLQDVNRRFRENSLRAAGTLSRFYLHGHSSAALTAEYLNAWQSALETGDPQLALANTIEVQNPAGRTIGLIVLPSHPSRVAWQSAYDELALQMRFEDKLPPRRIREALSGLDSAQFPFILPGIQPSTNFVFGDVLGLAGVAMVSESDREPKAAIATLAACFAGDSERIVPEISASTGVSLAREVGYYLDSHPESSVVRVHALRPGDAATVVRALGRSLLTTQESAGEVEEGPGLRPVAYQLDLHPSEEQSATAGAHLVKINQRRRAGVAAVPVEDAWSLESLNRGGGRSVPRLRWARRDPGTLAQPAHLAFAFDSFSSMVRVQTKSGPATPMLAFGLVANLQRTFQLVEAQPNWIQFIPLDQDGLKLSNRVVTDRLQKIQSALACAVARWTSHAGEQPIIHTAPTGDDIELLDTLHRLCDWVVSVDRNAGVEYYDSPRAVPAAYEAYLIDAVPERDDLGCLQIITSTAHFDEVRHLLDQALALMGLSGSMRNCAFLLGQLKGLSGRLAMRLAAGGRDLLARRTGSELIALALVRANCLSCEVDSDCWLPLSSGFLVPLDDVRDLFSPDHVYDEELDLGWDQDEEDRDISRRADMLFVSVPSKGRLQLRFAEVKYRRHLSIARSATLVADVRNQTNSARATWMDWFFKSSLSPSERAIRATRLVRALRFYAEKAHRHHLSDPVYGRVCEELDRILREPSGYEPSPIDRSDRAFIFCPDFTPGSPEELFPGLNEDCRVWLFGPDTLPDRLTELPAKDASSSALPVQEAEAKAEQDLEAPRPAEPGTIRVGVTSISERTQVGEIDGEAFEAPSIVLGEGRSGDSVMWLPSIKSNPHLMIAGLPGMGKTTCLINLCKQLVQCNIVPIVFSYHDDIDESLAGAIPGLAFSDGSNLGYNPMRVTCDGPLAHIESAGQLRDIFSAIFPDLGDLQLEQLRGAIKRSYVEHGWGGNSREGLQPPPFRHFLELLEKDARPDSRSQKLLARLAELDDFGFFRAETSATSLLDLARPQVLRVHALRSDSVQRGYASFALYSIYQDMFSRGRPNRITHAVVFDEAHRAANLKLIPTMAKECRKYGIAMIVASQESKDFDLSLFSAIANYLLLRVTDQDARTLARNVAPSKLERHTADRLKSLPKYEALFFSESNQHPIHLNLRK